MRDAGETLEIRVLGLATIAPDVSPELARATIGSLTVLGALHASPAVKARSPTASPEPDRSKDHDMAFHEKMAEALRLTRRAT